MDRVRLLARRNDARLAGPAAIKVRLNIRFRQREAWRAAIHNHAYAAAVRFAPGGDAEQLTEGIRHAGIVRENWGAVKREVAWQTPNQRCDAN